MAFSLFDFDGAQNAAPTSSGTGSTSNETEPLPASPHYPIASCSSALKADASGAPYVVRRIPIRDGACAIYWIDYSNGDWSDDRALIVLYLEGYSHAEIAEILGISVTSSRPTASPAAVAAATTTPISRSLAARWPSSSPRRSTCRCSDEIFLRKSHVPV